MGNVNVSQIAVAASTVENNPKTLGRIDEFRGVNESFPELMSIVDIFKCPPSDLLA